MKKFALITLLIFSLFQTKIIASDKKPEVKALGAVLMDYKTGRVLWAKNAKEPLPMASTTKIMTAVLALELGNMEDIVTVSKRAALSPKVKMNLSTGEKIKLQYLLYALMLESSNDAAVAIAEHIGGSVETFCQMMTDKGKEIGAEDTLFETPNGLDKGEHHSTAYDMALITRYALNKPEFVQLINTPSASFSSNKRSYAMNNKNRLLHEYNGATGVKTGFTGKSGHCFVGSALRDDMQLISVVLGSGWGDKGKERKWIDTKEILNFGFGNYRYKEIIVQGESAGEVSVVRSKTEKIAYGYEQGLTLPVTDEELQNVVVIKHIAEEIKAPINPGDVVGIAECSINGEVFASIDLIAEDGALRHDYKTSLEKILSSWLSLGFENSPAVVLPEF